MRRYSYLLLVVLILLVGCDKKQVADSPSKPGEYIVLPSPHITKPEVIVMPDEVHAFFKEKLGVERIFFIAVENEKDTPILLAPSGAKVRALEFPIETKSIKGISASSTVEHTGSTCKTYVVGGYGYVFCF